MSIVLDLIILVLVLRLQVKKRPLSGYTLPLILVALGIAEFGEFLSGSTEQLKEFIKGQHPFVSVIDNRAVAVALSGSLLIAVVLAAARVPTIRLWRQNGQYWRQGNVWTVVLWIASITLHLTYTAIVPGKLASNAAFGDFGSATLMLYFGASLITQRILLGIRARHIPMHENHPIHEAGKLN
ncbi:MAG TPA: hypothetical protein VIM53_02775 [Candidatus Saccharimonadales bacterium]